jgi:hypothetical protein
MGLSLSLSLSLSSSGVGKEALARTSTRESINEGGRRARPGRQTHTEAGWHERCSRGRRSTGRDDDRVRQGGDEMGASDSDSWRAIRTISGERRRVGADEAAEVEAIEGNLTCRAMARRSSSTCRSREDATDRDVHGTQSCRASSCVRRKCALLRAHFACSSSR